MRPRTTPIHPWKIGRALFGAVGTLFIFTSPAFGSDANTDTKEITPVVDKAQPSFWDQQYMLGDWGGERTALEKEGISFDFNNIGDFLVDVTGSQPHHATYFGRFRFTTDIDFNKLSGFDGEFFFSPIWQYGQNLSGQYLQVNTLTSSIAGTNAVRLDQMWYKQGFFNHMLTVQVGQVAPVNAFGATDFFDILFNDELGYAPNAIFPTREPFSPAGKPGIILCGDLSPITPGLYAQAGVFTAYDDPYHPDRNGFDYGDDFNNGIAAAFELGYKEQNTSYPGVYKLGSTMGEPRGGYNNPFSNQHYSSDYNIYFTAEKTVYHPEEMSLTDPKDMKAAREMIDTKKGLDLLFEFVGAPGDRNALMYEAQLGGRYTGLFPSRPTDKIGFGVIYSDNGDAFSQEYFSNNERSLGGEYTFELDYQYNPTPWFSLQPDVQYIMDPGGDYQRQDIVVLGLRTIVRF